MGEAGGDQALGDEGLGRVEEEDRRTSKGSRARVHQMQGVGVEYKDEGAQIGAGEKINQIREV